MTPLQLRQLADLIDPQELWRLSGLDRLELSPENKTKLHAAVTIRRYAHHIEDLGRAYEAGMSLLYTPLIESGSSAAVRLVKTPEDHKAWRTTRDDKPR